MAKNLIVFTADSGLLNEFRSCFEPMFSIYMASDSFSFSRLVEKVFPTVVFIDSRYESQFDKAFLSKLEIPFFVFSSKKPLRISEPQFKNELVSSVPAFKHFEIKHNSSLVLSDFNSPARFPVCLSDFCGSSKVIMDFKNSLVRASRSDLPILFVGGSGCGKSSAAKAVHEMSRRSAKKFFDVNISAIPSSLAESELFGSVKGAFTDSMSRDGYFLAADGGTLFLDEIGDADFEVQKKLLHVIETGEFRKVGSDKTERSDVRLLFATNVDLQEKVRLKEFRSDLFYRVAGIVIRVPQLLERKVDIPELCANYFRKNNFKKIIHKSSLLKLQEYEWPGNIRELQNCLDRAVFNSEGSNVIFPEHIEFF